MCYVYQKSTIIILAPKYRYNVVMSIVSTDTALVINK